MSCNRLLGTALILSLVMMGAVTAPVAAVTQGSVIVEGLSVEPGADGAVLNVRLSAPIPAYVIRLQASPAVEAVLEIPGAAHRLEDVYRFEGGMIRTARVETGAGTEAGVVLRIALADGATVVAVEMTPGVLRLHIGRSAIGKGGVPEDYRIGIGDKIEIAVFGHEDLTKVVEVRADGTINFPLIGNLRVAGKSAADVDDLMTRRLSEDVLVDPQVSVDVREYQSQWVTIIGEVRTPGRYILRRNMRLIDLLAEAGGATKEAGNGIQVLRKPEGVGESEQIRVDRSALLSQDDQSENLLLRHEDIVKLSEKEVFYIRGEVTKPGPYYLENDMTLMKAITVAGGLGPFGNRKAIELLRTEPGGRTKKIEINLKAIENGKEDDIPLLPNDTIIVPRRIF